METGAIDPLAPMSADAMVDLVVGCFGWPRAEVAERLERERQHSGWNVVSDLVARGVPPFVWSDRMGEFYASTQAFVYELLLYNATPERLLLRRRLLDLVRREQARRPGATISVLLWGDGLGLDALAVAQACPSARVTYFEISELSSAVAAHLFARGDVGHVRMIRALEDGDRAAHDVVAAIDVLEHVPDPVGWVREVASVLHGGGIAVIKEAFDAIIPSRPTHLIQSARRFAYRTPRLFERAGFVTEQFGNLPFVFRLGQGTPASPWARVYYHLTTPVKRARILPRLLRQPDPAAFLRACGHR